MLYKLLKGENWRKYTKQEYAKLSDDDKCIDPDAPEEGKEYARTHCECDYCGDEIFPKNEYGYTVYDNRRHYEIVCEKCYNEHKDDGRW